MTFQRSLYLSVFVHILLFGSAIAVAGYGGALSRLQQDHLMVSLVDSEGGSDVGVSRNARLKQPQTRSKSVDGLSAQTAVVPSPLEEALGERADQDAGEAATADTEDMQEPETSSASGAGVISGIGIVSAEQWALIEARIERSKSYPRTARERGIQGVVRVRFKLKPSGEVDRVEIARSSGYDVLDAASVKTVYRASPMPYVSGWLEVPMTYVLK
jgi:TonB family protein